MPDINLLGPNRNQQSHFGEAFVSFAVKILAIGLVLAFAGYGLLWYMVHASIVDITHTQDAIAAGQEELLNDPARKEVVARQGQLKELEPLVDNHLYWTLMFPDLAKATLKVSKYSSFTAEGNGTVLLTVTVNTYADLDKVLQVFDLPDYNQNIRDVKITTITKSASGQGIDAHLSISYNMNYLKQNSKVTSDTKTP